MCTQRGRQQTAATFHQNMTQPLMQTTEFILCRLWQLNTSIFVILSQKLVFVTFLYLYWSLMSAYLDSEISKNITMLKLVWYYSNLFCDIKRSIFIFESQIKFKIKWTENDSFSQVRVWWIWTHSQSHLLSKFSKVPLFCFRNAINADWVNHNNVPQRLHFPC